MEKPSEKELTEAALALGQATTGCSDEERAQIKSLYQKVLDFSEAQKAKGLIIDRSAFFAAGIILDRQIENSALKEAAERYVALDLLFVRGTN